MRQSFLRARISHIISGALVFSLALFAFSCVRLSRRATQINEGSPASLVNDSHAAAQVDINHANAAELATLPGIGPVLAERIVAHRQQYGPFHRAEHLMMVQGFSDHKYRNLSKLITAE